MSYYKTCSLCGAHLDPGEACDCVTVYTGHPGGTYVSMNIETGEIEHCSIYIGKDEPRSGMPPRHGCTGRAHEESRPDLSQDLDGDQRKRTC